MVRLDNPEDYKFMKFRKSNTKNKKYDAILKNKKTGRSKTIPFGQLGYEHWKDQTPLKLYSHLDHKDAERRKSFRARFKKDAQFKFSSAWFSWHYLW